MKFNKTLTEQIRKYETDIPVLLWFNYKDIKKRIKYLRRLYPDIGSSETNSEDCCCICLEQTGNMMHTFCCNHPMHYQCFIEAQMKSSELCPLCRNNNGDYFGTCCRKPLVTQKQHFDAKILEIISMIILNIMRIENICRVITINHKIMLKYREVNYVAVVKIAKKINKYLKVDLREYLLSVMRRTNILVPTKPKKNFTPIRWIKKQIEKMM